MIIKQIKILTISGLFLSFFVSVVFADTLHLKNGKRVEGIITREENGNVEIEVGGGTVLFSAQEIKRVEKSSAEEKEKVQSKWEAEKADAEKRRALYFEENKKASAKWEALVAEQTRVGAEKKSMAAGARAVSFVSFGGHMLVNTVLDGKIPASFVVDTGCPTVLLAASVAKQLGIDLGNMKGVHEVMVLNGKHKVATVILKSIKLGDLEVTNVEAEALLEDSKEMRDGFKDGLLGLSFLNRFNMAVDQEKMKLILSPREQNN